MHWLEEFIQQRRAWLEDAAAIQGVPADIVVFGQRQLALLEAAKATADAEKISVEEAVEISGLHPATIRRKARNGEFGPRSGRGRIYLTQADVHKLGTRAQRGPTPVMSLEDHFGKKRP